METGAPVHKLIVIFVTLTCLITVLIFWLDPLGSSLRDSNGVDDGVVTQPRDRVRDTTNALEEEVEDHGASSGFAAGDLKRNPLSPAPELERSGILFAGRVVDLSSSQPIEAYHFRLWYCEPHNIERELFNGVITDEEGHFTFRLEGEGYFGWQVTSASHLCREHWIEIPEEEGLNDYLIELDPGETVTGKVVDAATGVPVIGAVVGMAWAKRDLRLQRKLEGARNRFRCTDLGKLEWKGELCTVHTRSDAAGRFELNGLLAFEVNIVACHPDYAQSAVKTVPGRGDVLEIRLQPGQHVFGRALDDTGRPAAGVIVWAWGPGTFMHLKTATDGNGCYRTAPLHRGSVSLYAKPPSNTMPSASTGAGAFTFTPERRKTLIAEEDVEVNFGPQDVHVIFTGRVIDYNGEPLPGVWIRPELIEALSSTPPVRGRSAAESDHDGRFELRKLVPGEYAIIVLPPSQQKYFDWGQLRFDQPGPVEHTIDLRLLGGALGGTVVDSATGLPPRGDRLGISIMTNETSRLGHDDGTRVRLTAKDGRFCIRCLKPGTYTAIAMGGSCYSLLRHGITVQQGKLIEGIDLEITFSGDLELSLEGFSDSELESLCGAFIHEDHLLPQTNLNSCRGGARRNISLLAGTWEADLSLPGAGSCSRSFTIRPRQKTSLTVRRGELETTATAGTVTLTGRLTRFNGAPVADVLVGLENEIHDSGRSDPLRTRTDREGRFQIKDVARQRWTICVILIDAGTRLYLDDISLDARSSDPQHIELLLPDGGIRCTLVNAVTGLEINDADLHRSVIAVPQGQIGMRTMHKTGGGCGGPVVFEGLPDGTYDLWIRCEGFEPLEGLTAIVGNNRLTDLREVRLTPTGIVDITALDNDGRSVTFWLDVDGQSFDETRRQLEDRFVRYSGLPLGPVDLTISTRKAGKKTVTAVLEPGRPQKIRVVFD